MEETIALPDVTKSVATTLLDPCSILLTTKALDAQHPEVLEAIGVHTSRQTKEVCRLKELVHNAGCKTVPNRETPRSIPEQPA